MVEKVTRQQLVGALMGLTFVLESRINCADCGGSGGRWVSVGIGGDDVDYEVCQCQIDAENFLEIFQPLRNSLIDESLTNSGYDPDEIARRMGEAAGKALEQLKKQLAGGGNQ